MVSSCSVDSLELDGDVEQSATIETNSTPSPVTQATKIPTLVPTENWFSLEISVEVPPFYSQQFNDLDLESSVPMLLQQCVQSNPSTIWQGEYVFAVVAQFPTVVDEVSFEDIEKLWRGEGDQDNSFKQLLISDQYEESITNFWGVPDTSTVLFLDENRILTELWEQENRLALVPFEAIEPRMKVLSVDGVNPMMNSFNSAQYALTVNYCLDHSQKKKLSLDDFSVPQTNRDADKMTSILMTGVTALTRETAYKMEINGFLYPAEEIKAWFDRADIIHISNEVPFTEECLVREPPFSGSRFCSRPEYFELLEHIGTNVIELTGNHLLDYGDDAFQEMISILQAKNIDYYGGGSSIAEASQSLLLTHHGNEFEFFGCNVPGPDSVFATDDQGGANPCELDELVLQVQNAVENGKIPIVTFQHYEACQINPMSAQKVDMDRLAQAGAMIVSGSQAHCPQAMRFVEDNFVHYGLGNLFFDQMWDVYRNAFLDYHVFYDGRYLGVQLLTSRLEDASQPRPMAEDERAVFLETIFSYSDWGLE